MKSTSGERVSLTSSLAVAVEQEALGVEVARERLDGRLEIGGRAVRGLLGRGRHGGDGDERGRRRRDADGLDP
jgi:hypothetical protein